MHGSPRGSSLHRRTLNGPARTRSSPARSKADKPPPPSTSFHIGRRSSQPAAPRSAGTPRKSPRPARRSPCSTAETAATAGASQTIPLGTRMFPRTCAPTDQTGAIRSWTNFMIAGPNNVSRTKIVTPTIIRIKTYSTNPCARSLCEKRSISAVAPFRKKTSDLSRPRLLTLIIGSLPPNRNLFAISAFRSGHPALSSKYRKASLQQR